MIADNRIGEVVKCLANEDTEYEYGGISSAGVRDRYHMVAPVVDTER